MKIEELPIGLVKPYEKNPRKNDHAVDGVAESIRQFGFQQPIVIDSANVIIAGHTRYKAAVKLGLESVPCVRADQLTKEQVKAYRILDNKLNELAEWDFERLYKELADINLNFEEFCVDFSNMEMKFEESKETNCFDEKTPGILIDTFITTPISILDSTSGRWQNRKREWTKLLNSGSGRDECLLGKGLKDLAIKQGCNLTGTSIFDPCLCEILYQWFCPDGGKIIDPFAGGSVRGIVASYLEKGYVGVDLSKAQIDANVNRYEDIKEMKTARGNALQEPTWICADARDILQVASNNAPYDFLISCPPYFNLEQYTDDENDLSNASWEEFKTAYRQIFKDSVSLLKEDSFAAIVVGEVRNKKSKNGRYLNFVGETIQALVDAGAEYYNEMVLVNAISTAALRAKRQFSAKRKVVKTHQNVLVFVKGDASRATRKLSDDINWFEDESVFANVEDEHDSESE